VDGWCLDAVWTGHFFSKGSKIGLHPTLDGFKTGTPAPGLDQCWADIIFLKYPLDKISIFFFLWDKDIIIYYLKNLDILGEYQMFTF
jgi:hypothetical protein